jgi:hypothetical protein
MEQPQNHNQHLFTAAELDQDCVVSSQRGMQLNKLNKISLSVRMTRINRVWLGRNVSVAHFPDSTKEVNATATFVAGCTVRGNAIIVGCTVEQILAEQNRPKSWANLASALPKTVELDDRARARQAQEAAERQGAWNDYYRRKQERKRHVNMDRAMVNLKTGEVLTEMTAAEQEAADLTDAAFAEWQIEEGELNMPWDEEN